MKDESEIPIQSLLQYFSLPGVDLPSEDRKVCPFSSTIFHWIFWTHEDKKCGLPHPRIFNSRSHLCYPNWIRPKRPTSWVNCKGQMASTLGESRGPIGEISWSWVTTRSSELRFLGWNCQDASSIALCQFECRVFPLFECLFGQYIYVVFCDQGGFSLKFLKLLLPRLFALYWSLDRSTFDTDLGNPGNLGCCSKRSLGCNWCTPWLNWRLFGEFHRDRNVLTYYTLKVIMTGILPNL